jgi:hypothetical protein
MVRLGRIENDARFVVFLQVSKDMIDSLQMPNSWCCKILWQDGNLVVNVDSS